jgi:hypothetical protein
MTSREDKSRHATGERHGCQNALTDIGALTPPSSAQGAATWSEMQLGALRRKVDEVRARCAQDPEFRKEVAAQVRGRRAA